MHKLLSVSSLTHLVLYVKKEIKLFTVEKWCEGAVKSRATPRFGWKFLILCKICDRKIPFTFYLLHCFPNVVGLTTSNE